MPGRERSTNRAATCRHCLVALAVLLLAADRAPAYVGPGTDVTFISYAMTLLLWVLAAFSSVLLWPLYVTLRWIRGRKNEPATPSSIEAAPAEAPVRDEEEGMRDEG
jgi:hypothetical protein